LEAQLKEMWTAADVLLSSICMEPNGYMLYTQGFDTAVRSMRMRIIKAKENANKEVKS
jgi:hypothetical protein